MTQPSQPDPGQPSPHTPEASATGERHAGAPELTFPPAEAACLREAYEAASVILEYGSGGSTWLAAGMPGKTIVSVESDRNWAQDLSRRIVAAGLPSVPMLHRVDIGPVGKWGKPRGPERWQRFPDYALSPWDLPGFPAPDLVLIDGRFRAACFAATCLRATRPTRVLFDDYHDRPYYRVVERLLAPRRMIGRMAEFEVLPAQWSNAQIQEIVGMFFEVSFAPAPGMSGPHAEAATEGGTAPETTTEDRLRAKISKLKTQRLILGLPWALVASPVLLPYLALRATRKSLRRRARRKLSAGHNGLADTAAEITAQRRDPAYEARMAARPDDFVLYRIIGNDLEPRHSDGQSIRNVQFILENETPLQDCRRKWLLNRIYDPAAEAQILALLHRYGEDYTRIPFSYDDYAQVPFDVSLFENPGFLESREYRKLDPEVRLRAKAQSYRLKNNYVMHNNGARNAALFAGRNEAKWVLPFDGNCFLTPDAWEELRGTVLAQRHLHYFTVPMARFATNEELLAHSHRPDAKEEPQILFRCDAAEHFDAAHPYGRRPKVELLVRLGVPGPWDNWRMDPWDLPMSDRSPDAALVGTAGWVARLASGKPHLERSVAEASKARTTARSEAIIATLDKLDDELMRWRAGWYRAAVKNEAHPK